MSSNINFIAHMGYHKSCPQNTLAAFTAAMKFEKSAYPVIGIELDIQLDGSGQIVVFHDPRLHTNNNETKRLIRETSYATLTKLVTESDLLCGHKLPLLSEVLTLVNHRIILYIEIKAYDYDHTILVDELKKLLDVYGPNNDIVLHSFSADMMEKIVSATKHMHVKYGFLFAKFSKIKKVSDCLMSQLNYLHPSYPVFLEDHSKIADYGLPVNIWTVNSNECLKSLLALKEKKIIEGIITDDLCINEESDK